MDLREYYESRKKLIDRRVEEVLREEGLAEFSETPLGGKRLRGVLLLLVAEALGGRVEEALDAAVAIELAHAASLDADDIVDQDETRRGKPATWITKGVIRAVLASHGLVAVSLNLIKKYGLQAVNIFAETYRDMVKGEYYDVSGGSIYEAIIGAKTASLWAAAAGLGAIAAGKPREVPVAKLYGYSVGMAFQIADDIVDTYKLVEERDFSRLRHPSVLAFLAYIGLQGLLANPMLIIRKGIQGVKEDFQERAMRKLDEWVNHAKQAADKLNAARYKDLLKTYPELAVELMLQELGGG